MVLPLSPKNAMYCFDFNISDQLVLCYILHFGRQVIYLNISWIWDIANHAS